MNIHALEEKLNKIQNTIQNDHRLLNISENIKKKCPKEDQYQARQEYYSHLKPHEALYQKKNDEYKDLISQFSKAYVEMSDFYVGPELPREHYLQSKKDVIELYTMFAFYALWEPYINAYYDKFC